MEVAHGEYLARLKEIEKLCLKFVNAKGRYHSQIAMCNLMDYLGKPCVRPKEEIEDGRRNL